MTTWMAARCRSARIDHGTAGPPTSARQAAETAAVPGTSAIFGPADVGVGLSAFLLLVIWAAPWLVVILGALAASALAMV